ncbi:E3 ubiquitin-protein ligase Siah1 [Chionoecetes opilio]|uniref:RING-type E3 ubiquitin transferase n=1 Tax=Chionoecetes opilio TaxID=41210 RepID=A0A8J4YDJ3_CHIOP|nr:E3 ubiquitin-protein ligase Siah1 [Chionoecetes opilio]
MGAYAELCVASVLISVALAFEPVVETKRASMSAFASKSGRAVHPQSPPSGAAPGGNTELASLFECPVCFDYVLPPILQCQSGHLVCANCRPKLTCCPTCRGALGNIRNLAMEKVASTVMFPCKYSSSGCSATLLHTDKTEHEDTCEFRPYMCPCPGASCKWQGSLEQVMPHLMSVHKSITTLQDSLSSLHLLLSRHPRSSTSLVHTTQRALHLTNEGWEIAFQWVPSHAGIPGNEVADSAARMALTEVNTTPFPLPLSTATRLISRPWIRKKSRVLDVTLTRLRLGHTRLTAHLHRLCLSPDPHCPWCMNIPETIEHFLLQCPRFHSHHVVLQSQLLALNVTTFDLPTLLAAAGVPPSRQHAVIRLTCAFLRKTGQLPRL